MDVVGDEHICNESQSDRSFLVLNFLEQYCVPTLNTPALSFFYLVSPGVFMAVGLGVTGLVYNNS